MYTSQEVFIYYFYSVYRYNNFTINSCSFLSGWKRTKLKHSVRPGPGKAPVNFCCESLKRPYLTSTWPIQFSWPPPKGSGDSFTPVLEHLEARIEVPGWWPLTVWSPVHLQSILYWVIEIQISIHTDINLYIFLSLYNLLGRKCLRLQNYMAL